MPGLRPASNLDDLRAPARRTSFVSRDPSGYARITRCPMETAATAVRSRATRRPDGDVAEVDAARVLRGAGIGAAGDDRALRGQFGSRAFERSRQRWRCRLGKPAVPIKNCLQIGCFLR